MIKVSNVIHSLQKECQFFSAATPEIFKKHLLDFQFIYAFNQNVKNFTEIKIPVFIHF